MFRHDLGGKEVLKAVLEHVSDDVRCDTGQAASLLPLQFGKEVEGLVPKTEQLLCTCTESDELLGHLVVILVFQGVTKLN